MSDINRNDVESLFATKRKQQQAEDAQKAAQLAESEKFAELQRKKREMEEEISRLQSIKEKQEEEASYTPAPAPNATAPAKSSSAKGSFDFQKYKMFIFIGAGVLVLAIIIIIIVAVSSKSDKKNNTDKKGGISNMSDPEEDYEVDDYTDFMRKVDNYDWNSITDEATGIYFEYPAFLETTPPEEVTTEGYTFSYAKEEYGYAILVNLVPAVLSEEENENFDPDDFYNAVKEEAAEIGYDESLFETGSNGNGIYYFTSTMNGLKTEDTILISLLGKKDDITINAYVYLLHSEDGTDYDIGFNDIEYMFRRIKNSLSFG